MTFESTVLSLHEAAEWNLRAGYRLFLRWSTAAPSGGRDRNKTTGSCGSAPADPSPPTCHLKLHQTMIGSSASTTNYTCYDAFEEPTATSQITGGQTYVFPSYCYNLLGELTLIAYPSTRVVLTAYDSAGRATSVARSSTAACTAQPSTAYSSSVAYAPNGAIQQMTMGNGLVESTNFNARFQPTSIQAGSLLTLGYSYCSGGPTVSDCSTNNGDLMWQTVNDGSTVVRTQQDTYDGVNRLTSASESTTWTQTYVYDNYGNRALLSTSNDPSLGLDLVLRAVTTSSSSVPFGSATNRWTFLGATYDGGLANGRGNLTDVQLDANNTFHATYDAENRQKSVTVTLAGGSPVTTNYSYDGEGKRVSKVIGSTTSTYVYDAHGNLAAEYSNAANTDSGTHYLTSDHLGSTRLETQLVGNSIGVVSRSDYLPFGQEIPTTWNRSNYQPDPSEPLKFTGKERDSETGLDNFGARYNSGAQGRFTSPDPYEIVVQKNKGKTTQERASLMNSFISNPQAWNKYAYGLNNPLKNIDIGGHCSAPAGLKGGQTGICIEAFISAKRFGPLNIALGDGRKVDPNGGTYRVRGDVRIDPGASGQISTSSDVGKSSVIVEGLGLRGTGGVALAGTPTTDADGNRHFTIIGEGENGFSGAPLAPKGDISFKIEFTVDPSGNVNIDSVSGRSFPSLEVFSYQPGQPPQLLFAFSENQIEDLQKPQKRLDQEQQ